MTTTEPRKRPAPESDNAGVVADHYNARPEQESKRRRESPIINLRNFNNWIKGCLISTYVEPYSIVLDLCCGKAADLKKYADRNIRSMLGVDIASESIEKAIVRYNKGAMDGSLRFQSRFIVADCFKVRLLEWYALPRSIMFDAVSCQFALHYSFESEAKVWMMLRNVTDKLRPGGHFFGTTADARTLVRKLHASPGLEYGNTVYRIRFDEDAVHRMEAGERFGLRYLFSMEDAIDDCPEYLVHFPTLVRMAAELDLELVFEANFHDFYAKEIAVPHLRDLFGRMRVVTARKPFSEDQWDATYLYMVFVFRKKGESVPPERVERAPLPIRKPDSNLLTMVDSLPEQ
eukprot:Rmarinus@m.26206